MNTRIKMSKLSSIFLFLFILSLVLIPRLIRVDALPLEVDESVNWYTAHSVITQGYPSIKQEIGVLQNYYLFHPPIVSYLMARWLELTEDTITSARILCVLASLLSILLMYLLVKRLVGKGAALVASVLVATDSWLVITQQMYYLENIMMPFLIATILIYQIAKEKDKIFLFVLAGMFAGFSISLKYIGVYILLAIVLDWFFIGVTKKNILNYVVLFFMSFCVIGAGIIGMFQLYGPIYIQQSIDTHMLRVFGLRASRGMNFGIETIVNVISARYWVHAMTVVTLVLGIPLACIRWFKNKVKKIKDPSSILFSWVIASALFASLIALKSPHYLMLWLLPVYAFLGAELARIAKGVKFVYVMLLIIALTFINTLAISYRINQKDAIKDTVNYLTTEVSSDEVVITEPYIGQLLKQKYIRIDRPWDTLAPIGTYIALYETTTSTRQHLDSKFVKILENYCPNKHIFYGFKETITVCRIKKPK